MKFLVMVSVLFSMTNLFACPTYVNDYFQKKMLILYAANHLSIALSKVTQTEVLVYKKIFTGMPPASSCPNYLETQAIINFKYAPDVDEFCEAQLTVRRKEFVGNMQARPIETVSYADVSAICAVETEVAPAI